MRYYSLNNRKITASFKEACIRGIAPDNGLYFPEHIPPLQDSFFDGLKSASKAAIAYYVLQPYIGSDIPKRKLETILEETFDFPFPLVCVSDDIFSLELFHGPTLAFKDVGARFMSRCLGYFLKGTTKPITVLVATSGDTGGAVAHGFLGVEGVNVVILYPAGKVSDMQERQLTTLGNNITALQVQGNFDDCQQMVKKAFGDGELNQQVFLTSANSINVARWLPQQLYYFFAQQQWPHQAQPPVVSVPSGNFGNIAAGLLAQQSGLPVQYFIAACNANDVVPHFMQNGQYNPKHAIATLSNAMDVGNPSNFVRILEMFGQQLPPLQKNFSSVSISDAETKETVQKVFETFGYTLDPHGAVAFAALLKYKAKHALSKGYFVETAHPVKFKNIVEEAIQQAIPEPESVVELAKRDKAFKVIPPDFDALRAYLLQ